jgi:DNA (cytosine-5)-methyltransferase 1
VQPESDTPPTFWSDAIWVFCRDGKWRPVGLSEPQPLAVVDGASGGVGQVRTIIHPIAQRGEVENRIGKIRGYGNCLVAEHAAFFVRTVIDHLIEHEDG